MGLRVKYSEREDWVTVKPEGDTYWPEVSDGWG